MFLENSRFGLGLVGMGFWKGAVSRKLTGEECMTIAKPRRITLTSVHYPLGRGVTLLTSQWPLPKGIMHGSGKCLEKGCSLIASEQPFFKFVSINVSLL
jgi:hypothetical protein